MRDVCIHGHFYQPPREDPWTERVARQPSAAPYHDWNERVTEECYRPNLSNYARMSFNFGPTLLAWFERGAPDVLAGVVAADRAARERFGGHGPALAQAWGHPILPLCTARDRRTQVLWGLKDFSFRFGRHAEGMWLPETAVDTDTLETLSGSGIAFTVLAPHQAAAVRPVGGEWRDVGDGSVDGAVAYRAVLPSGRSIALFFYDGPVSAGIAFAGLARDGEALARRLREARGTGLAHVATDGETYGHHQRGGDLALGEALDRLESDEGVRLTCYGEFLERKPPRHEVRILERSSWSCPHALGRWERHCGCAADGNVEQHWRTPLREAVRRLRDDLERPWERAVATWVRDPWAARDDWIETRLDRSDERWRRFLESHALAGAPERAALDRWFELQQRLLQTETSCAWFFEDLARIETIQVLRYAARAIELAERLLDARVREPFLAILERALSNDPAVGDGRALWHARVDAAPTGS